MMEITTGESEGITGHPVHRAKVKSRLVFFFLLAGFITACNNSTLYNSEQEIEGNSWHKDSVKVFRPVMDDTSEVVSIGFSLEHNSEYPYSNLWLFVDVESPDGEAQIDTMEYFLAEPNGEWIGDGNDRSRRLYWLYKGGVKMAQPGEYKVTIQQGMRRDKLNGVQSVSLWIEKAENQNNSGKE
ncbi:MAG: gliding motility lipoprotein GldH [Marinilabiliaceae bacterium]